MRESMEGNLLKNRNEHGERDIKQSINLLTTGTLEILWKMQIYVFSGSKRVLASVHGPKGGKEAKALLISFYIFFPSFSTYYGKLKWK